MTQRKVTTTVELADGQTFAIAGLLNSSTAASTRRRPAPSAISRSSAPLFRTMHYSRKETEIGRPRHPAPRRAAESG